MSRISIYHYAHLLALAASRRSEDPHKKVGAVAFDRDNRVISTGYNGAAPKVNLDEKVWEDRDKRLLYVIHAEQNLCSGFKRNECAWVYTTLAPCYSCLKLLEAHGVPHLIFWDIYEREDFRVLMNYVNMKISRYDLELDELITVPPRLDMEATCSVSESFWS